MATPKTNRRATPLRTLLALLLLLVAACGAPPSASQPTASGGQSGPTAAPAPDAGAAPTAAGGEASPADIQAQTIGEQLDLGQLSPDIPGPSAPVTITFATWNAESEGMLKLVEQFQELHPNITIDLQSAPAEEMQDKLLTQVAGGTAPDVAYMDTSWVIDFASRSALVNLDEFIAKSNAVDADDYVQSFRDSSSYQGSMYALPVDGESTGLFYRTDLFEAAGIAGPPKTWEEFEDAARRLTDPDKKQYGFALFATEAAYYWYPWLWQAGGRLLSEDGSQIAFNDEAGKRAAEFYVGLKEYAPQDYLNSNSWDGRVAFANGTVGMYVAGAWFAGTLREEFPDIEGKWAAAALPQDKQCGTTIAGDVVAIFAQSKQKEAAWKWIEFLSAPQVMASQTIGTPEQPGSLLPPRKSLIEDPRAYENNDLLRGFAEQMECGVTNSAPNENYGQVEQVLNEQLARAIFGEIDAAAALDEAAREGQELLAE